MRSLLTTIALAFSLPVLAATHLPEETPYAVVIEDVLNVTAMGTDGYTATLKVSAPVPNSLTPVLLRTIEIGRDVMLTVIPEHKTPEGFVGNGAPTRYLHLQWDPNRTGIQVNRLKGTIMQQLLFPYSRKVIAVKDLGHIEEGFHNLELTFDAFVPNGDSTLVVDPGTGAVRFELFRSRNVPSGRATVKLEMQAKVKNAEALVGKSVRVYTPRLPGKK